MAEYINYKISPIWVTSSNLQPSLSQRIFPKFPTHTNSSVFLAASHNRQYQIIRNGFAKGCYCAYIPF